MSVSWLRGIAVGAFALGLGLLVFGFAFAGDDDDDAPSAPDVTGTPTAETPSATATATRTPTPGPTATSTNTPSPTPTPFAGEVAAMRIPRFDVDAVVENIGLGSDNVLEVPADPLNVGWYGIYDRPGWNGNAVFSAHVDYYPSTRGPFYNLADSEIGDEIVVVMENGIEYKYRVISNERYTVDNIPTGDLIKAREKPDDAEWITLITCGGDFVRYNGYDGPGYYKHRDVVVAERFQ